MVSISRVSLLLVMLVSISLVQTNESVLKRNSSNNVVRLPVNFNEHFVNNLIKRVDQVNTLQTPYLVQTEDSVVFVNESEVRRNLSLTTTVYDNLKVISHLPVTLVSILTPELLKNNQSISLSNSTILSLIEFQGFVQNVSNNICTNDAFVSQEQLSRQQIITSSVLGFISRVPSNQLDINTDLTMFIKSISPQLQQNSDDAVSDYLHCLNRMVSGLELDQTVFNEQLVVILSLNPFSQVGSFLFQYYQRLLNINSQSQRLILLPQDTMYQSSVLYKASLHQTISEVFYRNSSFPVHNMLSESATQLICSPQFILPSCKSEAVVLGFNTRIEKSYVVLMMIFGGIAALLGIVLCSICYEDKLMACERKSLENKEHFKLDGPNVLTPLCSLKDNNESSIVQQHSRNSSEGQTFN